MTDPSTDPPRPNRRLRQRLDRLATGVIAASGIGVVVAVLAIGVYLTLAVLPLFDGAEVEVDTAPSAADDGTMHAVWLADDGTRWLTREGQLRDAEGEIATLAAGATITTVAEAGQAQPLALGLSNGEVRLVPRDDQGRLRWTQAATLRLFEARSVAALTLRHAAQGWVLAGRDTQGEVAALWHTAETTRRIAVPETAEHIALGYAGRLAMTQGTQLTLWQLSPDGGGGTSLARTETRAPITALSFLQGGRTLIVGDANGGLHRWRLSPDDTGWQAAETSYTALGDAAIRRLIALPRQRLWLALDDSGRLGLYQSLSGQRWHGQAPEATPPTAVSVNAQGTQVMWLGATGTPQRLAIEAAHAAVSPATLWMPQTYEGHSDAEWRWAAAVTGDEEPQYSLVPLAWGTLKAAAWAMVFAVPLALGAAVHSACYMSRRQRARLKPAIELMEALPGVVIGFVAGLFVAPFVERHLAGTLALFVCVPLGSVACGWLWRMFSRRMELRLPPISAGVGLIVPLALLCWAALSLSPWLEAWWFGGDLRAWMHQQWGWDYAQRNALIVGMAMGLAIIPTLYSLAEEALSGVPRPLAEGSLALGATRAQTLWRVQLPAAAPGILSAVMIGAGRAVGETMIVLMVTGNTPLMSPSLFEGLRSLAANLAIELPEAAVGGTQYRLLLLGALLLFVFTFVVNTLAEMVRWRLKRRYRRYGGDA
ncbi:ABC transporter permease subunit [Chromohalobacter nigrandesensis]|uniref:ABC transporter permease subunit n=1 Tax=Chromohalobacter nigrandesensis TaxID=119863 RepID=UPI001FF66F79|nr:ABC transporter permease subunit [Chromohalobacter nigrandesensis]MCK0744734.1 ABC transporter permease subunit [Chromohalobacter nigrandesensis]